MDLSAGMIAALEAGRKRRLLSKQHVFPNTLLSNGRARIDHPAERSRNKVTRNRKKRLAELLVADTLAAQQQFEERNTAILESQLLHPLESVSPTAGAGGGGKTVALTAPIFSSGGRATTATTTTTATASAMSSGPIIADSWAQWQAEQRRSWELARLQEPDDYNHHSATALPCYPSTHAHDNQRSQQQQPKRLDSLSRSLPPLGVPVLAGPNLTTTTTTPLPLSSPTPSKRRHHPGEEKGLEEKRSLANAPVKPTSTSNGAEQQEEEVEKEVAEQGTGDFPKTTQLEAGPIKHVKEERGQEEAQRNLRHQSSSSHRQKRGIRRGSDSSESNNNIRRRSSSSSSSSSRKANADNSPEGKKTAAMEDYRQNENSDNDGGSSQDAADSHNNLKAEQQQQQQQQLKFEQPSSQGPREGWQDKKVDKETEKEEEEEKEEKEEKEEERRDRRGNDTRLASSPPMKKGHSSSGGNGNGNGNVGGKREWCLRKSEELESTATKKYKNRHQELFSNSSSSSSSSSHVGAVDQLSPGGCSRVVGGDDGAGGEKRRRRRKGRIRKMKEEEEKVGARATKSPSSFLKGPLAVAAEAEAEAERYHRGEVEAAGRGALSKRHHASSVSPSPLLLPHSCRYSLSASQSIEDSLIDAIAAAAIANTAASTTLPPPPPSETRANESAQEAAGVHASPSPPSSAARAVRVAATAAAAVSAAAAAPGKRTPRSFAAVSTRVSEDAGRRLGEGFLDMAEKTSTDRHHYGSSVDVGRGGEEVDGGGGGGGGGAYEKDDGKRVQADGGGGGGGFAGLGLGMDSERPRRRRLPRRTDSAATAWKEKKKKKQDEDGGNNKVVGVGSAMVRDLKREYDASQARFARFNALRTTLLTTRDRAREKTRQLVASKALAALRLGLRQWKEWAALQRNVELVVAYRKVRGGRGVGQVLLRLLSRHAKDCFLRWHHACLIKLATAERDRAARVLQASVARGWLLGRRRLLRQGEEAAAVEIQRCVGRGALTRLRVGPLRVGPLKAGAGGDSLSSSFSSSSTPSSSSRWWGGGSNDGGGGGCGAYDCTSSGGALEQFEQRLAARAVEEVWWRVQLRREWRVVAKDSQTRQRAVVVQCWWRRFSSVKVVQLKRNALRVHNSAVAVQARARQLAAKVVVGKVREEKRVCSQVTSVQSLARWKMGKKRALRRRKAWSACILIQKNWRLGLPKRRKELKRKHKAATKLSAAVRMLQAKSLVGKKRRRQKGWKEPSEADKHASAALVTSSVRVKVAKNAVKKKRAEREVKRGQCATRINGVVRSKKARQVVLGKKQDKASVKIQRKVRGQLATKKVNKVRAKKKAGFWLWVAWHAKFWARRAVAATLHKRFVAETANSVAQATKIQSGYRGLQGRRRGLELKEAKEAAEVFKSREKAATFIQVVLRSNQKRQQTACRVASVKRAKEQAECKGQRVLAGAWRQFQARKLASALRSLKRTQNASAVLTRLGRGLLGRSKAKILKARRAELLRKERWRQLSATAIQAWKRAVFTRRLTRQLLQERRVGIEEAKSQRFYDSAVVIQCLVRCWRAHKRLQSRLAVRKKQLEQSRLDHELELELAQLHCKLEETLFAVRLQCFARKSQAVEKMANAREAKEKEREAVLLKRRHNGAAAIQSLAKGRAARKWFRHNAARLLRERNSRQSSRGGRGQGGRGGGGGGGGLDGGLLSVQEPNSSRNTRAPQADGSSSSSSSSKNKRASVGLQGKGKGGSISGSSGGGGDNSVSSHNGFKKLFDDSAKAHYWYNEATQEAQWTDPAGDA